MSFPIPPEIYYEASARNLGDPVYEYIRGD
jgi:hypothetical protein